MTKTPAAGLRIKRSRLVFLSSLSGLMIIASIATTLAMLRPAPVAEAITPPDTCFGFNAGTGTITGYYANEGNNSANPACTKAVDIPGTIGGVTVTSINAWAFSYSQLSNLTLPSSVTTIGDYAFSTNQLASITLPSSVTAIGDYAFGWNRLTDVIILGNPTGPGANIFLGNPLTSFSYNGTSYSNFDTAETPVGCFEFNPSTGQIISYRHFSLVSFNASTACVSRNIIIPSEIDGVIVRSASNLVGMQLTGVSFPDTITNGVNVGYNYLTSLDLPSSLTEMKSYGYVYNSLRRLTIPGGVAQIDPFALYGQNPWGNGILQASGNSDKYIHSTDPAVVQHVYDNIWYVRAYTADNTNPNQLTDYAVSEWYEIGSDDNQNGTQSDSLGGHIINPASTVVKYQDSQGNDIASNVTITGLKTGKTASSALDSGDYLHSYLVTESAIPAPLDIFSPTPEEQAAMELGFSQYYRMGDSVTFSPRTISGYTTPSAKTVTLNSEDNSVIFVYDQSPTVTSVSFTNHTVVNGELRNTSSSSGPAQLMAASELTLTGTGSNGSVPSDCSRIQSASLIASNTIDTSTLSSGITVLGGLNFSLSCSTGGQTGVNYSLGEAVPDITKLRVYKYSQTTNKLTDITHLVTISNQTIDGKVKTVISYNITDGGELDEDGTANGVIADPLVIGYQGQLAGFNTTGRLADTGASVWITLAGAITAFSVGTGLLVFVKTKAR